MDFPIVTVLATIWEFLAENFWSLALIFTVIFHGKDLYKTFIFDPLAGGNGKVQMDELAKGIVIAIIIWAVQRDGYRDHEWTYFSDAFYAALLAALFAIASIKPIASVLRQNKITKQSKDDKETEDLDSDRLPDDSR